MYYEPDWSQSISKPGFVEVLKDGKIFETIPIPAGCRYLSCGRLLENDISLEHESISRKHAVIQFGPRNTAFIFDLGSTHGTFMNKRQIPSCQFIKLSSGNSIFQLGASSRLYILNLEEDGAAYSQSKSDFSAKVSEFFKSHGISLKRISFFQNEHLASCSFDFSDYISVHCSESTCVSSSGSTKEEAYENFFEDSFNLLYRLGKIEDESKNTDYSDSSTSEEDFFDVSISKKSRNKGSDKALSEKQILSVRDQSKTKLEAVKSELDTLERRRTLLEEEIVDDFDIYIQDMKKAELNADIEKRREILDTINKECLKNESLLKLIGFKENIVESEDEPAKDCIEPKVVQSHALSIKSQKLANIVPFKVELTVKSNSDEHEDHDYKCITDFEDSTLHEEKLDMGKLKRKYGY